MKNIIRNLLVYSFIALFVIVFLPLVFMYWLFKWMFAGIDDFTLIVGMVACFLIAIVLQGLWFEYVIASLLNLL